MAHRLPANRYVQQKIRAIGRPQGIHHELCSVLALGLIFKHRFGDL